MHGQDHTEAAVHTIWNRVVKLSDAANPGSGLVCARQGVDLVDLCVKNSASPDTSAAPGATGSFMPADGSDYEHAYRDIDVRDCSVLRAVVQDTCAFAAPEGRRYSAMCHALEKTKLLTMYIRRRMRSTACTPILNPNPGSDPLTPNPSRPTPLYSAPPIRQARPAEGQPLVQYHSFEPRMTSYVRLEVDKAPLHTHISRRRFDTRWGPPSSQPSSGGARRVELPQRAPLRARPS